MANYNLENLLYSNFIEYYTNNTLGNIVAEAFKGNSSTSAVLFIDMYSIIKSLYGNDWINTTNDVTITASVINMCAHYREGFRKFGVEISIYIIFSSNTSSTLNEKFIPKYNSRMKNIISNSDQLNNIIKTNCNLLSILCPYLPNIYFIPGTYEIGAIIASLIKLTSLPNIIISKDPYLLQLVTYPNTVILRPLKNQGDKSYSIYHNAISSNFWERYSYIRKINTINTAISPTLISMVNTLSRMPERSIYSIFSIPTTFKIINDMISNHIINNDYTVINTNIINYIESLFNGEKYGFLEFRFKAIDLEFQKNVYENSSEYKIALSNIKDYNDSGGLNVILNQYFNETPIEVYKL